ncbi:glycosyltransferase [Vibrio penaeicida]|uniref:glycosyltransferase family 2 protein n=1 Tax=Vibrio penaeicida TaxID=104609 RepID=UPI0027358202|nr:glycosyltransferase [Vibrio penaeicida]MDP2573400.1 glycosyltransferase [Vibrio penaeicida]
MKLSIIIPSYQSQKNLRRNLSALAKQLDRVDAEVIVVDCSPNDDVDKICAQFPFVCLLKEKQRFNPGGGRNIGARAASGEYLVFVDADVVLDEQALVRGVKRAKDGAKIFGGALELDKSKKATLTSYIEHYYFNHESQSSRTPTERANLSSALMIIEKALFDEIGGFSDIPRMQDTELTERLVKEGHILHFFPDVIGYQIQDSPFKNVIKKIYITGNNLFFLRYETKGTGWLLALFLPFIMLAKITRINLRNLKYAFSPMMLFVLCPIMYVCGLAWMMGFYKGIFISDGIEKGR